MRKILRWDKPIGRTSERFADVADIGRYHVKRRSGTQIFDVRLNGKLIADASSAEEAIRKAERHAYALCK